MAVVKVYNLDDDHLKEPLRSFTKGDHVIGRGELKCDDKRISRRHAIISVTDDSVELKAIHINPCFYKAASGKSIEILGQDTTKELHDGDTFALLADKFWFRVKLMSGNDRADDEHKLLSKRNHDNEQDTSSNKRTKIDASPNTSQIISVHTQKLLENIQEIVSEDYPNTLNDHNDDTNDSVDLLDLMQTREDEWVSRSTNNVAADIESQNNQQDEISAVAENKLAAESVRDSDEATSNPDNICQSNKEDATNETNTAEKSDPNPEPLSIKKEPEEEANAALKTEPPEVASITIKKEQKEEPTEYDSTETSLPSAASSSGTTDKPKTVRRDRCWYGANCYRKNPIHRQNFSHPGDTDYDSDPDDDRPSCPFGNACYRTNMDHRRQYKHSAKPAPKPSSSGQKKALKHNKVQSPSFQDLDEGTESEGDSQPTGPTLRQKTKAVKKKNSFNETPEDDYDLEDPFIDDASSDAFEPSDDDDESDLDDEVESADENEDMKRLVKEAKRFTKTSGRKVKKGDQNVKKRLLEEEGTDRDLKKALISDSDETGDEKDKDPDT